MIISVFKMKKQLSVIGMVVLLGCDPGLQAQQSLAPAFPALRFTKPVDVQHAGDGSNRLFVVEQRGVIHVFENAESANETAIFLDIQSAVRDGGERGLLGLAFHPEYQSNGFFFVNYTAGSTLTTRISRFQVDPEDPNRADPNSEVLFLQYRQPFGNHNGGGVVFGPDGYLYIGTGDGGSAGDPENNGQDMTSLLGKMLRLDIDQPNGDVPYGIPPDNPFLGQDGVRPEIYALGLRNPWRYAFDEATGQLWAGDVGQGSIEEIDLIESGGNYGWRKMEGTACFNPSTNCTPGTYAAPIFEYTHAQGKSVTGGRVYHGSRRSDLAGHYIFGDYVSGKLWALDPANAGSPVVTELEDTFLEFSTFGVDEEGELLIVDYGGELYRFASTSTHSRIDAPEVPQLGGLESAFPNPFDRQITITYALESPGHALIKVYDVTGRLVRHLVDTWQPGGTHALRWDGTDEKGLTSPGGLFFLQLEVDGRHQETKGITRVR